jgi:sugar phosphate isomerase/epimerase
VSPATTHKWSVFTKPWSEESIPQLGSLVSSMGFDGVELPVRPGYQVQPDEVAWRLPEASRTLSEFGISITSIAGPTDSTTFAACADSGIPLIRIMVPVSANGYSATETDFRRTLDSLVEKSRSFGVRVGIQPHYDDYISDSTGLFNVVKDYDPTFVGAIWDSAHDALARKAPEHALEILWPWLALVNFKNAYFERIRDEIVEPFANTWEPVFTDAKTGMARWDRAINYLVEHEYHGGFCLTAEYTDEAGLVEKLSLDLAYAKQLWEVRAR